MRREPDLVKNSPDAPEATRRRSDFRRHLQGYELGLVTIAIVLAGAALALPRASEPLTVPLPRVDRVGLARGIESELELVRKTEAEGLPFDVRAVGESIRRFGKSVTQRADTGHDRQDIRERLAVVLARKGEASVLALRAVQTEYFARALGRAESEGKSNPELDELGGGFLEHAKQSGWLDASGRLLADESTRRVLFRMHFVDLLEKRGVFPFAPTLEDWRVYYRFLLVHPERSAAASLVNDASDDDAHRLRIVNALGKKDPEYPALFAKGTLLYRLGDREGASAAFRAYLGAHESGPYALLARNHLIYTLQGLNPE